MVCLDSCRLQWTPYFDKTVEFEKIMITVMDSIEVIYTAAMVGEVSSDILDFFSTLIKT